MIIDSPILVNDVSLSGSFAVTGSITPGSSEAFDLGSSSKPWRDLYVRTGSFSGDVTVAGNLTVNGLTTTINSNVVTVGDNIIVVNTQHPALSTGGIYVYDTALNTTGSLIWDSGLDRWRAGLLGSESDMLTANSTDILYNKTIPITGVPSNNISGGNQGGVGYFDASGYLKSTVAGASGQLLQSAGAGTPTWVNFGTLMSGSSVITGSGTTNYLSKFSSGNALTNSLLFDDGTNVGVGTSTSLSYKLQVQGTGYFSSDLNVNGSVSAYSVGTLSAYDADTRIGTYVGRDIIFGQGSSGTEFGRFLSSGLLSLTGSVEPGLDLTYDLGSNTKRWRSLSAGSLSGSLTRLIDGTSYIIAGGNMSVITGSNGAVLLSTINSGTIHGVTAGNGLLGGGTSDVVTLSIDDGVVATVSGTTFRGTIKPSQNNFYDLGSTGARWFRGYIDQISGSLTQLVDGTSYLIAGTNMQITTGSNGSVTVTNTATGATYVAGIDQQVQFNDGGTFGASSNLTFNKNTGALTGTYVVAQAGFSGSLTRLTDGTSYIIAGGNMKVTTGSNGALTLSTVNSGTIHNVIAGNGLLGGGNSGDVTLFINDNVVATISGSTFSGVVKFNAGLTGSLTKLPDGSNYLLNGSNIVLSTGSQGAVTIAAVASGTDTQVQFNDGGTVFGAHSGLTYNKTSSTLNVINVSMTATNDQVFSLKDNSAGALNISAGTGNNRWTFNTGDGQERLGFWDGVRASFGDVNDPDLNIQHDGANSRIENKTGQLILSGANGLFLTGTVRVRDGISGSLTRLSDGTSYIIAGGNMTVVTGSNGALTLSTVNSGTIHNVIAGNGLLGGGNSGDVTLTINDSVVATVSGTTFRGTIKPSQNNFYDLGSTGARWYRGYIDQISGSLTTLVDGTSYLIAGSNIAISTGSNGAVTITNAASAATYVGGTDTQVQFNDGGSAFGGDSGLTYNKGTDTLSVTNVSMTATADQVFRLRDNSAGALNISAGTGNNRWTFNTGDGQERLGFWDGVRASFGDINDPDLNIQHDGANSRIENKTGQLILSGANGLFLTGTVRVRDGISGSLTRLSDGTSYLISSTNIQITTGSNGSVTIANTATGATYVAGTNTQVQFNDGGTFGADGDFTFDKTQNLLKVTNISGSLTGSNVSVGQVVLTAPGGVLSGSNNFFWNDTNGYVGIGTSTVNSRLTIGNSFASINGIAIDTGGSNDSAIVGRRAVNKTAFGLLPWDTSVFFSAGTYYDGNLWTHHNASADSQIFELVPASGVRWWASSDNTVTFNVANAVILWDDGGRWKSSVQSTRAEVSYFTGGNVGIGTTNTNGNKLAITGGNLSVTGSVLPGVAVTYDLGSTTYRWRDLYARTGSFTGDVIIAGDLTVNGTQTIINTQVVEIEDNAILVNAGPAPAATGGIYVADTTTGMTGSLLWDCTTDLWKAGKLGSEVTLVSGSGTNNYLAKWNGSNAIGNSVIHDNGTNVGVGTTATSDRLSVNGSMSVTGSLLPGVDNAYDLGSNLKRWSTVYAINLSGSLTQLANGTSYMIAGSNVTITTGSTGAVTISAPNLAPSTSAFVTIGNDATLSNERALTPGNGILLTDAGANSTVTLSINDGIVATVSGTTFTGATKHNAGLSGSLTQLTNGTSYLIAGNNIQITTGSTGAVTIAATATGATFVAGTNTQVQFNDGGTFGADADFTFDKTRNLLRVTNISGSLTGSNVSVGQIVVTASDGVLSGTNNFFWSNSNGRVGIGTSSPGYKLDVPTGDASFYGVRVGRGASSTGGNVVAGSGVALASVTSGIDLTAIGDSALAYDSSGSDNTAIGFGALFINSTGNNNTAVGSLALFSNDTSANSTAVGYSALGSSTGARNTAFGSEAGYGTTSGADNVFIGYQAGYSITTGGSNTIIGSVAGTSALSNTIILAAGTAERIRVDSNGNVGIGTTLLDTKLVVNGNSVVSGSVNPDVDNARDLGSSTKRWRNLYATNISGSLTGSNLTAGQVVVTGLGGILSGSNTFWWDNNNGRVGIGTTIPVTLLTVSGTIATRYGSGLESYTATGYASGLSGFYPFTSTYTGTNDTVIKYAAGGNSFVLYHGSIPVLTAASNETVSIGAGSYTGRLFVSGSATASIPTMVVREGVVVPSGGTKTFEVQNSVGTSLMYVSGSGEIGIGTDAAVITSTTTTTSTSPVTLLAVSSTVFRSAEFVLQAVDSVGGKYHTAKILAIHNGSVTSHTEYGAVTVGGIAGTFDVTNPSGGFFNLQVTPASTNSTVWKVTAILTKA